MTRTLAEVLAPVRHVLLDFDGPVCSVFGELPAPVVARRLAETIDADLPDEVIGTDPLALLTVFAERGRDTLIAAEAKLAELEMEAVRAAPTTPGVVEALEAFRATGRTVTIVSNNSQAAVEAFVAGRGLDHLITGVCSRQHPEPELLKPNPFLLRRAILERSAREEECVMVGDNATDIRAARSAQVLAVGVVNKPYKATIYAELHLAEEQVVQDLFEIEGATRHSSERSSEIGPR